MILSEEGWKRYSNGNCIPKKKHWIFLGKNVLVLEYFMKITQHEWNEILNFEMVLKQVFR